MLSAHHLSLRPSSKAGCQPPRIPAAMASQQSECHHPQQSQALSLCQWKGAAQEEGMGWTPTPGQDNCQQQGSTSSRHSHSSGPHRTLGMGLMQSASLVLAARRSLPC
jgi:hypothetical protein